MHIKLNVTLKIVFFFFQEFGELSQTREAKALMGLFFGQTECKKNHYGEPKRPVR